MKTKTQTKPAPVKPAPATIGAEMLATAPKAPQESAAPASKGGSKGKGAESAKAPEKGANKGKDKAPTLYFFQTTPGGKLLRAYFVAFIMAQIGKLESGKVFRLWPGCNISGHLATGKVERDSGKFKLSPVGARYFAQEEQAPDADHLKQMLGAIKTGKLPECYRVGEMSPVK